MKTHCCETMTRQVNAVCKQHPKPSDCPDQIISYSPKFDEYGLIIHDGGSSTIEISFCPWCGIKLPPSKCDLWFDTLEALGFDDPFEQEIPQAFQSDKWYRE